MREFIDQLAGRHDQMAVKAALEAWFSEASKANWASMTDVKAHYRTASVISSERVVFNIGGNKYRLVVALDFEKGIAWIKWIGTHKAYDRIDVSEVKYGD